MDLSDSMGRRQGLRVARVWGVDVWLHWFLLVLFILRLITYHLEREPLIAPLPRWGIESLALLLAVFLHEMGHVAMARRVGGSADQVLLWPLGGLAYCRVPPSPTAELWVAAAGPMVNLVLFAAGALACWLLDAPLFPTIMIGAEMDWGVFALQSFNAWNAFPLLLNLLPCYPLDGGRMLFAVLWGRRESRAEAAVATRIASRMTAIAAIAGAVVIFVWSYADASFKDEHPFLSSFSLGLGCVALLYFLDRGALLEEVHGEGEESGIFGYDFSRGYTSLEGTQTRTARHKPPPRPLKERLRLRRETIRRQKREEVQPILDALLEKVHEVGLAGLTRRERRFLRKASRLFKS